MQYNLDRNSVMGWHRNGQGSCMQGKGIHMNKSVAVVVVDKAKVCMLSMIEFSSREH